MELILRGALQQEWSGKDVFTMMQQLDGEIYRDKEGRQTMRFRCAGDYYFRKLHSGIGWLEIFKNFSQAKMPVLGAINEWQAINRVEALGLDTLNAVAYGKRGWNPATQLSFLVTEELTDTISLEDYASQWSDNPPSPQEKRALIAKVAHIARTVHQAGINHRDFYICHFLLDQTDGAERDKLRPKLFLVDLHRAQIRGKVPGRWLVKDIASIYFSCLDIGLTRRDVLRFMQIYFDAPLRETLQTRQKLLARVTRRAVKVYEREFGRTPTLP